MKITGGFQRRSLVFIAFAIVLSVCAGGSAWALTSGGIGGYPAEPDAGVQYSDSWFIYNLDNGESKRDSLHLQNTSEETQTIKLYPVDSVATGDGNFALRNEQDPREGVGAWIILEESEVTLQPSGEKNVFFTIAIPENASVGEHSGGIILQKTAAPSVEIGQTGASIITRIGIRVYETVPGDLVKKIELVSFNVQESDESDTKPLYRATLAVENKSNVSLKAEATLNITGWGKTAWFPNSKFTEGLYLDFSDFVNFFKGESMQNEWQLLRDQKVETNWEWKKPLFGHFIFQAVVSYDGVSGREIIVTEPVDVWVMPWTEIGVIGALVVLLLLWGFAGIMRGGRTWKEYQVRPGDQLGTIATAAGISWKKLAKANRLKSPTVTVGQTIKVPQKFVETPVAFPEPASMPVVQPVQPARTAMPRVMSAEAPASVSIKPRVAKTPAPRPRRKKIV